MSISRSEYRISFKHFVDVLKVLSRESPDTKNARLTLHSDGRCELNLGDHYGEILTVEQLAKRLDTAMEEYWKGT